MLKLSPNLPDREKVSHAWFIGLLHLSSHSDCDKLDPSFYVHRVIEVRRLRLILDDHVENVSPVRKRVALRRWLLLLLGRYFKARLSTVHAGVCRDNAAAQILETKVPWLQRHQRGISGKLASAHQHAAPAHLLVD